MKCLLLLHVALLSATVAIAQDLDIDKKTGLVSVDGKEAFYLTAKNKVLWQADYSLENLSHEELAYLKAEKSREWNSASGSYQDATWYSVTFSKSGNYCELRNYTSLNIRKSLAKDIAAARLVVNGNVSPEAEQKFVVMHNGTFLKSQNAAPPVVVNVNSAPSPAASGAKAASIALSGEKIYNNDVLVGTFRTAASAGVTTVSVYGASDDKIATARHTDASEDDWEVALATDGKSMQLRYYKETPLLKLFKALAERGYL